MFIYKQEKRTDMAIPQSTRRQAPAHNQREGTYDTIHVCHRRTKRATPTRVRSRQEEEQGEGSVGIDQLIEFGRVEEERFEGDGVEEVAKH